MNYLVNKETEINKLLNSLGDKGVFDQQEIIGLKPHGSQPGAWTVYGT